PVLPVPSSTGQLPEIPGYEVLVEIGRGGMCVVYQARHRQTGRLVAIKMIKDSVLEMMREGALDGPRLLAHFRIAAEVAALLKHPRIVQIHEAGEENGRPVFVGESAGRPYLVLEYIEGLSLARLLNGQPLPTREAALLVETLARAMHHAHQCRIIHRDLKPANVLLSFSREPPASAAAALAGGSRLNEVVP